MKNRFAKYLAFSLVAALTLTIQALPANAYSNTQYKATQVAKPAPAGTFAAGAGGDGWGISVYNGKVYNIFHNSGGILTLDCHNRSDGRPCWNTNSAAGASGWTDVSYQIQNPQNTTTNSPNVFLPAYGPGQWIDPTTGILYVYTVNQNGTTYTPGIAKVDTSKIDPTHPFNGATTFTALAANTVDCTNSNGVNCLTATTQLNRRVFDVNYVNASYTSGTSPDANKVMCYSVDTAAACSTNPIVLPDAVVGTKYAVSQIGTFGDNLLIPLSSASGSAKLECISSLTLSPCAGWSAPTDAGFSGYGGAFPMLNSNGDTTGVCIPDKNIVCYNMSGTSVALTSGLTSVLWNSSTNFSGNRNGAAVVVGTRVFVPTVGDNKVHCINWAVSGLSCGSGFPFNAATGGASSVYTVGSDSNDPTCVWLNSDHGTSSYTPVNGVTITGVGQMQSFDAYSGGACGQGGRKLLVASFIAPGSVCVPVSYVSIQLSTPNDPGFTTGFSGTVGFLNTAGTQLLDASSAPVSSATITDTGTVTFPANLNNLAPAVVPIFQVSLLHSGTSYGGDVAVTLTWVSSGDPACTPAGYSVAPFTVSFDLNGPTAATLIETVTQGAQLSTASLQTNQSWNTSGTLTNGLPTTPPTWGSVAFLGWFTSPSGGTQVDPSGTAEILANTTYYAQWSYATWTITFDANGGIPLSPDTETINQGSDLSTGNLIVRGALPQPLWSDSTQIFDGWFDTTTAGTQISESAVPAGVTTYYAHWVPAITVTTSAASSVTDTSANLNGGIVGTPDTAFFCFDDQIFDSSIASTNPDACSGATAEPLTVAPTPATYSFNVSGLTASTTYYFMQIGSQAGNIIAGSLLTFATTATPAPATPAPATPTPTPAAPVLMSPTITWSNPAPQVGPYTLGGGQLNALCSVPGSVLTYSPAAGTVLQPGTYSLHVTCTPPNGSGYGAMSATVSFTVTTPVGTLTWPTPPPARGPLVLTPTQLNAVCSIPGGTLSYVPAVGSKLFTGTHDLKVTCTPPAGSAYQPLTTSVELVINSDPHVTAAVEPASAPQAEVVGYNSSKIWWAASPKADGYYVTIGGVTACTTTALSCKVAKLIGPKSQIAIYATLAGATSTPVVPTLVKPSKPQVIGIIYFDTAKYNVRADQQPEINRVARLLLQLGYTDVNISGHTDTNPFDNITLSNNRALTLKKALGNLVPGLSVNLHYYGATDPIADNGTVSGQAKNRRAEISVW